MRAFDFVTSSPWLITSEALETIIAISERTHDIEALQARRGSPLANARKVSQRDGTAIIPITGPIFRYANLFTEISGGTSTDILARDLRTALDDPAVKAVLLDINSPGGMAAGINELGDMVFAGRKEKPIIAYAGGQMASAAYWIGSAADEVVADRTSIIGSIGAKLSIVDTSQRDAKSGVRTIEIVSSQSPDKNIDVNQDEGRAKLQTIVDDLATVFVESVARNRGVDVQKVLSDFGKGGQMVGQAAVDAGMADRLGSLESVLAELYAASNPNRSMFFMKTPKGPITVSNTQELRAALADGHVAEEITVKSVDVEQLKAEAKAAGAAEAAAAEAAKTAEAVAKASADATATERKRVADIQEIGMKGFEQETSKAIATGLTVEQTAIAQAKAVNERGTSVGAQQTGAVAAVAHGGKGAETGAAAKSWGHITEKFNKRQKKGR